MAQVYSREFSGFKSGHLNADKLPVRIMSRQYRPRAVQLTPDNHRHRTYIEYIETSALRRKTFKGCAFHV